MRKQRERDAEGPLAIIKHFAALEDPRVVGRSDHPLLTVITVALVGVICGAEGWDDIHEVALDKQAWLEKFVPMPAGVPSADTVRRVVGAVKPEAFSACVSEWVQSLAEPLDGQVVAFDGKTLRGALKRSPLSKTLHQVHAWATKQRLLLAQVGVAGAPEEVDAVRRMLDLIELRGAIITADAAHCCAETAAKAVDAGADYVLQLKGNRASLHAAVEAFFEGAADDDSVVIRHAQASNAGHGRKEHRRISCVDAREVPLPGDSYASLRSIAMMERTRETASGTSVEKSYYLSSLRPSAKRLANIVRDHWSIENHLHWTLDAELGEDASRIRDENAARNFSSLLRVALMMLQRETSLKRGIAARRAKAARNDSFLASVMRRGIA
jgi:predicted transposase YbfD/YdcC